MEKIEIDLRKKFIKDNNLPIQVLESPYFEYFLDLYEPTLGCKSSWAALQKEIKENHDGRPGKWIAYTWELQEKIISDIRETIGYHMFNIDPELDKTLKETPGEMTCKLYSGNNLGVKFLSIDLKKANFQALHWYSPKIVLEEDTWGSWMSHYTTSQSFISSKQLRQIILGKTNPKRLIRVERYLMWKIQELVSPLFLPEESLFSRTTDEIIFKLPDSYESTGELEETMKTKIKESLSLDVKVQVFTLQMVQRFTHSGASIKGFIKDFTFPQDKTSELKDVPKIYYPQIYKAWKGLDLNPTYDLVLYFEGELARFDYPLTYINPNERNS